VIGGDPLIQVKHCWRVPLGLTKVHATVLINQEECMPNFGRCQVVALYKPGQEKPLKRQRKDRPIETNLRITREQHELETYKDKESINIFICLLNPIDVDCLVFIVDDNPSLGLLSSNI
jgi:hypothetical protein